jgi:hypothetical protein
MDSLSLGTTPSWTVGIRLTFCYRFVMFMEKVSRAAHALSAVAATNKALNALLKTKPYKVYTLPNG